MFASLGHCWLLLIYGLQCGGYHTLWWHVQQPSRQQWFSPQWGRPISLIVLCVPAAYGSLLLACIRRDAMVPWQGC